MNHSLIELSNLKRQSSNLQSKVANRFSKIIKNADFIQGEEVKILEDELKKYTNTKNVITCGNGTDALFLALKALDIKSNEYVICPSYSFIATAEIIPLAGGIPYFVDVETSTFNISIESLKMAIMKLKKNNKKIRAIISVDLFGLPVDYEDLINVARENKINLIADCAQSFGAKFDEQSVLSVADIATTSFFPTKPLGCYGDGGAVFTKSDESAEVIKSIAIHGKGSNKYDNVRIGVNSRLDTLQAAVLLEKLMILDEELDLRNKVANKYSEFIEDPYIKPRTFSNKYSSWAQYTIIVPAGYDRASIMQDLSNKNIVTSIFYPKPLHLQIAYKNFPREECKNSVKLSNKSLSLPMGPYLEDEEIERIVSSLNQHIQ